LRSAAWLQQTTECALLGVAQVSGKQLPNSVAVIRLLDAVLKGSDKKDHLRVNVSGDVQGDTIKVTSVKLL
jgi:hypothetical protein